MYKYMNVFSTVVSRALSSVTSEFLSPYMGFLVIHKSINSRAERDVKKASGVFWQYHMYLSHSKCTLVSHSLKSFIVPTQNIPANILIFQLMSIYTIRFSHF